MSEPRSSLGKCRAQAVRAAVGVVAVVMSVAAHASPGLVTGEAIGSIFLHIEPKPLLDIVFASPQFSLSYASTGDVHEDGFETGYVEPSFGELLIAMDVYAFALAPPLATTPVSETHGQAAFASGVVAIITNFSAVAQVVDITVQNHVSLAFAVGQPHDRVSGRISYRLRGRGDAAPIDFGYAGRLAPPPGLHGSLSDSSSGSFSFALAPAAAYRFTIDDYQARFFLHAAAVPEPAIWIALIAGFGLTGTAMRRRRTIAC